MNTKYFKILAISMIVVFLLGPFVSGVAATSKPAFTQSNGKVDVQTDQATISVTGGGNIPFYNIKLNGTSKASYEVKFSSIQEFVDKNGNGLIDNGELVPNSGVSLASLNWDFSGFSTTNDSSNNIQKIDFNFTSAASSKNPEIQLRNHIDVSQGNSIKFDLIMAGYTWTSTNTSAKLAVKFQIAGGNITQGSNKNDLSFGEAQFSSVSTASTPDGNINVNTQVDNGNSFYLIYDHFNGNFEHDPTFSAVAQSGTDTTSSKTSGVSLELLPILTGLALVGILYTKKRKVN